MADIPILGHRPAIRICRGCGCDDNHACTSESGPCSWVLLDVDMPTGICSVCADEMGFDPRLLMDAMCDRTAAVMTRLFGTAIEAHDEHDARARRFGT